MAATVDWAHLMPWAMDMNDPAAVAAEKKRKEDEARALKLGMTYGGVVGAPSEGDIQANLGVPALDAAAAKLDRQQATALLPPDFTDLAVSMAAANQVMQQRSRRGRSSAFVTGPAGTLANAGLTSTPSLLGG